MPAPVSTLTEHIYALLRKRILDHSIPPGTRLVIADVAKEYEASPTPVRECFRSLAQDGLIEFSPRRGAVASTPSFEDYKDVYEIRSRLESLATGLACGRISERDLKQLNHGVTVMQSIVAHEPITSTDFPLWVKFDDQFHSTVVGACPNRMLRNILSGLFDHIHRYRLLDVDSFLLGYSPKTSLKEHQNIIAALKEGDEALAEKESLRHIQGSWKRLMASTSRESS